MTGGKSARGWESEETGEREMSALTPTELTEESLDDELSSAHPLSYAPTLTLTVPTEAADKRIDLFLVEQIQTTSRSSIQRAITNSEITVNDKPVKPSHRLAAGELMVKFAPCQRNSARFLRNYGRS